MDDFDPTTIIETLRSKARTPEEVQAFDAAEGLAESNRVDQVLQDFGVPKRIRNSLARNVVTRPVELIRAWMQCGDESWAVVLSADKGVGKSTAAGFWLSCIASSIRPDAKLFKRWWPAAEIAAMDFYGEDFRRLCEIESLVIDDLGVEYSDQKGAFQSKLDRLLDARYRELRRTVITTNLGPKAFRERYDQRIYDRLREGARWESIVGQSLRGTAA